METEKSDLEAGARGATEKATKPQTAPACDRLSRFREIFDVPTEAQDKKILSSVGAPREEVKRPIIKCG